MPDQPVSTLPIFGVAVIFTVLPKSYHPWHVFPLPLVQVRSAAIGVELSDTLPSLLLVLTVTRYCVTELNWTVWKSDIVMGLVETVVALICVGVPPSRLQDATL